jgi:hypothetical protein
MIFMENIFSKSLVEMSFFTQTNIRSWEIGQQLLSIVYTYGKNMSPQLVDYGKGWRPVTSTTYQQTLQSVWPEIDNILFCRKENYESQFALLLGDLPSRMKLITLWIEEAYFSYVPNIQDILVIGKYVYDLVHPKYGLIHKGKDKVNMATFQHTKFGKTVLPVNLDKGLPGVYWANFLSPKIVETIGKEKLLSASWSHAIELSDGGFLTLIESSPLSKSINQNRQEELQIFLGLENFYTVLHND